MDAILVTCGAGFVGLNLVEALLRRGEHVVVFGREAGLPPPAAASFASLPGRVEVIEGDVRDPAALRAIFAARRIGAVFPFAAVTAATSPDARPFSPSVAVATACAAADAAADAADVATSEVATLATASIHSACVGVGLASRQPLPAPRRPQPASARSLQAWPSEIVWASDGRCRARTAREARGQERQG
jgi:nucleoside-diphosphate-sugar epimerase